VGFTAFINFKIQADMRSTLEKFATDENLSLAEAARHFMSLGIRQQETIA
jgi:hypothetical protein